MDTATCVILNSSDSSGSDLDNVTLYQAVKEKDEPLTLKKISEGNLDTAT